MSSASELRDRQREDWKLTAPGWKKWDQYLMQWLKPVGEKILDLANLTEGDIVLDVATGSGEPGLSAARRVGRGKVIGLDISQEMVSIARGKAKSLGIKNYEARVYSSSEFPFESDSFEAVVSRFGVMFFPDVLGGLKEMVRVLRKRGSLSVSVWGPQNERAKSVMQILIRSLGLPQSSAETPNPFRCSEAGKITSLLRQSGLHDIEQVELPVQRIFSSVGQYWEYLLDTNPIITGAFNKAGEETRSEAKLKVDEVLGSARGESGQLTFESVAWVNHGAK